MLVCDITKYKNNIRVITMYVKTNVRTKKKFTYYSIVRMHTIVIGIKKNYNSKRNVHITLHVID